MKRKKIWVIGITLLLLALVASAAFAYNTVDGVIWVVIDGRSNRLGNSQRSNRYTEIYNDNNYAVIVRIQRQTTRLGDNNDIEFAAKETKHFDGVVSVRGATKR